MRGLSEAILLTCTKVKVGKGQLPHKKMLPEGSLRRKRMKAGGEYVSELLFHGLS
jgi:hypothetical protein